MAVKETLPPDSDLIGVSTPWKQIYAARSPGIEYHFAKWRWPDVRPVLPAMIFPGVCRSVIRRVKPDLINLHWVDHNFVSIRDLDWISRAKIPLVWTLHDMGPLAGGFPYREAADLPAAPFGPTTCQDARKSISEGIVRRRTEALAGARIHIVSPSRWLAEEARRSGVFDDRPILHIPYGLSTADFSPMAKDAARAHFQLPQDRRMILFGAAGLDDPRKGFAHLKAALEFLASDSQSSGEPPPMLVCFGGGSSDLSNDLAFPSHGLGSLNSIEDLRAAYSLADVFVCPSREDNLPNTVVESISCGTPVVGFKVGGIPDLIEDRSWGGCSPPFDEKDLAIQIGKWIKLDEQEYRARSREAREYAIGHLDLQVQATAYENLYREILTA